MLPNFSDFVELAKLLNLSYLRLYCSFSVCICSKNRGGWEVIICIMDTLGSCNKKCPDYQGVLTFQVSLYDTAPFGIRTKIIQVSLLSSVLINRFCYVNYLCMPIYICIHIYIHACMHVCVYMCACTCVCVCVYVCVCVCSYHIHGIFGSDCNMVVRQFWHQSPSLMYANTNHILVVEGYFSFVWPINYFS